MTDKIKAFFKQAGYSILMVCVGIAIGMVIFAQMYKNDNIIENRIGDATPQITLDKVKIAYIPETDETIFIDRTTNAIILLFSKEATAAVYSLKSSAMQDDYTKKGPAPSKRTQAPGQQVQQPK